MGQRQSIILEAVVTYRNGAVQGTVVFRQDHLWGDVRILVNLRGLSPGMHGFHIHRCGDLRNGCESACDHYNPSRDQHGGLTTGHAGDLGNIVAKADGSCKMTLVTNKFNLQDVVGRALIIHQDKDDLGQGNNADSLITGNSGKRIACEIIGISKE
jgi:Cu-Zn family superoxide dismutase